MATGMVKWDPFAELGDLRSRIDRMLGDLAPSDGGRDWVPAVDVERNNGNLVVRADIPGITPDEVRVEVEDEILTVSGHHEDSKESKDKHYLRRERRSGAFSRSIALPSGVDAKKIKATVKDGVVEVKIPIPAQDEAKVTITPTAA